ncbi:hypothetical protein [Sphingobium aromaticiconvertens]|uniref:hypothetical protein n=1 Tax=Sphingobium aromaticiconvertens TaxID=365341 RepID=UPI003018B0A8
MLKIAKPALTTAEWQEVRQALNDISTCGCTDAPRSGSIRDRIGKAIDAVTGHERVPVTLPSRLDAVRRFTCESGRLGRVAQNHVPTLAAQGFSRAQIDAIALLGA